MADSQAPSSNQAVLLIENLHAHKDAWTLARRIFRMLTSVGVVENDILSIAVEDHKGKARIHLRDKAVQDFTIKVFSDVRDVMNFFNVRKVTDYPMGLKLSKAKGNSRSSVGRIPLQPVPVSSKNIMARRSDEMPVVNNVKELQHNIHPIPEEGSNDISTATASGQEPPFRGVPGETPSSTTTSVTTHLDFERLAEEEESSMNHSSSKQSYIMLDASTSVSGLPPENKTPGEGECGTSTRGNKEQQGKAFMVDVKTSTPQVGPCFCPETIFYHKNQHVGTETRHAEFKQGGVIFEQRQFRSLLGRYLCAFLNTEGGVIYFGVTDDGRAIGINIDQKFEDQIRLSIDSTVSAMRPVVPTSAYSVNFAKVMDASGQILSNLKVLEVCVHPRYSTKTPYSYDNAVYVRRDGSLRTM